VAAPRKGRAGRVDVLGIGQQPSRGLKAGVVIELDAAEQSVRAAVAEAERAAGCELRQVLLAVACGRLKSTTFAADTKVEGRAVGEVDLARLLSAGRSYVERDGRALLHMNTIAYRLDGAQGIADPRGLAADTLSVDLHAVTADDAPLRNLVHVAERAYLSVTGLVPAPYASGLAVTTPHERRAGVLVLDFGAGTTSLALFVDGHLLASEVIPVGGHHISFDLARGLTTSLSEAERNQGALWHSAAGPGRRCDAHLVCAGRRTRCSAQ
jgi:cell division protein FtsA